MGPPPPDMPKDQFVTVLRQRILEDNTFGVVHILKAWVYVPRKPNDHTMKQILTSEIAMSDLKRGDKTEALVVRYECRDGSQRMWISPIVRPKTGSVALGDALELGGDGRGPVRKPILALSSAARSSSSARWQRPPRCGRGLRSGAAEGLVGALPGEGRRNLKVAAGGVAVERLPKSLEQT